MEYQPKAKRAYAGVSGLTPFPRTGRSDPEVLNWDNSLNLYDEYEGTEKDTYIVFIRNYPHKTIYL